MLAESDIPSKGFSTETCLAMSQPRTSRAFLRVSAQRLAAAEILLREGLTLDAYYLGGYTLECAIKALILELTPSAKQEETLGQISSGKKMHDIEVLLQELAVRNSGRNIIPFRLIKSMRRIKWTTDIRYETGSRKYSETAEFLATAKSLYEWAKGQVR